MDPQVQGQNKRIPRYFLSCEKYIRDLFLRHGSHTVLQWNITLIPSGYKGIGIGSIFKLLSKLSCYNVHHAFLEFLHIGADFFILCNGKKNNAN